MKSKKAAALSALGLMLLAVISTGRAAQTGDTLNITFQGNLFSPPLYGVE